MSAPGLAGLAEACREITAPGSDPELVAALVAWAVRPRRTLEGVRRALASGAGGGTPARRLRAHVLPHLDDDDAAHAAAVIARWVARGCQLSVVGDPGYPSRLAEGWPDTDGPVLLAASGQVPEDRPTVALVGSRRASSYGTGITAWLAEAAGEAGAHVISGGAVGIDAAAHRAAVHTSGGTSVVLACGHDVDYPRSHARPGGLFDGIRRAGGALVSEQLPAVPPRAGVVRARNRIVAALADVVVVVEGGARSGALLTATAALERDRVLLAVPGDVRASGSVAPNRLLGEGAHPCTGPGDLLEHLDRLAHRAHLAGTGGVAAAGTTAEVERADPLSALPAPLHAALRAAWPRAVPVDVLLERAELDAGAALAALTRAQVAGEVAEGPEGVVLCRRPAAPQRLIS